MQVTDPIELGMLLGQVVGEFGERFGRADPYAHRQPGPLPDTGADQLAHSDGTAIQLHHGFDPQEGLVDAVDLQLRAEIAQDAAHPVAHVAIERVVGREGQDAVLPGQLLQLKPRGAHLDTERLDLVAAGHGTAIVVREHHHRDAFESGLKDALAGDVEVVDVHQRKLRCGGHG